MTQFYILDIYETNITGFTTYKDELFFCLEKVDNIILSHVIFYAPVEEFCIIQEDKIRKIYFPAFNNMDSFEYYKRVLCVLQLYIPDTPNTIFFHNFSPAYPIVMTLRKKYIYAKIVFIIHDFIWAHHVLGYVDRFCKFIKKANEIEKETLLFKSYKDGIDSFQIVDKIVTLSVDTSQLLKDLYGISQNKLMLIPNGLRESYVERTKEEKVLIRKRYGLHPNTKIILFVGRICETKGAFALLSAFKTVLASYSDCKLAMIGSFSPKDLQWIADEVKPNILFLGVLGKQKLYDWYSIADIGVIPSYYEQCSYTGIEMMMHQLPIVASDGFGLNNMFNEENAIIAKLGNRRDNKEYQQNLFASILQLLSSEKLREKFAKVSRESYMKYYDIRFMKKKYLNLLSYEKTE